MNNADYKNKKTFNKQNRSNKFNRNDSRDDIYTPKTYPKKNKISQFDSILESLAMPEYMDMKQQANAKRQRDLKYKNKHRK